ncbi:hypothetical protein Tco_0546029, partial [Tanacetum coccineum]
MKQDVAIKNLEVKEKEQEDKVVYEPTNPTHKVDPFEALGTFSKEVKRRMKEEQGKLFLESLEMLPINIPFFDTLKQIPEYTKCLRELVSNKTKIKEVSTVKLNARCS